MSNDTSSDCQLVFNDVQFQFCVDILEGNKSWICLLISIRIFFPFRDTFSSQGNTAAHLLMPIQNFMESHLMNMANYVPFYLTIL
jgi:hypothetical protein